MTSEFRMMTLNPLKKHISPLVSPLLSFHLQLEEFFFFFNYFSLCERSVVNDRQERAEVLQQSPTVPTQTQPAASQP